MRDAIRAAQKEALTGETVSPPEGIDPNRWRAMKRQAARQSTTPTVQINAANAAVSQ